MMDITRNQYFLAGLVLLFLGLEFHFVDSLVLSPEFTQFLAERSGNPVAAVSATTQTIFQTERPSVQKTVHLPEWMGWCFMSIGSVLILHSAAMKKPG